MKNEPITALLSSNPAIHPKPEVPTIVDDAEQILNDAGRAATTGIEYLVAAEAVRVAHSQD